MISELKRKESGPAVVEADPRWAAVLARDARYEGAFVYSVETTGVYCRPTCSSRRPNVRNVAFHADWRAAERAGFRACLRCRPQEAAPDARRAATIAESCRRIEAADEPPRLDALAAAAGLSRYHFHRLFKSLVGMTPKAYAAARRGERMRAALAEASSVTHAIYAAGFNSSSRFYEVSAKTLGMTAKRFRSGGAGGPVRFAVGSCSLGAILVAAGDRGVCAISLGDDPAALERDLRAQFPAAQLTGDDPQFKALVAKVVAFVEAPKLGLDLPLDLRGTAFQKRVWMALSAIPVGTTASYADVARRIGAPKSARAVARACAANKLAVAVPCHRVVRSGGALADYRWGVQRKRALLDKERRD